MITFDKFEQGLTEGKQVGPLYHFTTLPYTISMIHNDIIKGRVRSKSCELPDNKCAISFTRDKNFNKKGGRIIQGQEVRLTLNGDKLSDNYKIVPYSYLGGSTDISNVAFRKTMGDEMEEMVIVPKGGGVKKLSKYVTEIRIYNKEVIKVFPMYNFSNLFSLIGIDILNTKTKDDIYTLVDDCLKWFKGKGFKVAFEK